MDNTRGPLRRTNPYHGFAGFYLKAYDSDISGNGTDGINTTQSLCSQFDPCPVRAKIVRSNISGNGGAGIRSTLGVQIVESTISGNGEAGVLDVGNIQVSTPDRPPRYKCSRNSVQDSILHDNAGSGFESGGRSSKISESQVFGNGGHGIAGVGWCRNLTVSVEQSDVTGNGLHGILADRPDEDEIGRVRTDGVNVIGNGMDSSCGTSRTCADVASRLEPKLAVTMCETSYDANSGFPGTNWSACTLD